MKCKILVLCMVALLLFTGSYTVLAEEWDADKTGSISVTLAEPDQNTPVVGAELSLYYVVAAEKQAAGNWDYAYTADFAQIGVSMDDKDLADTLDTFVAENAITAVILTTDATGTAVWKDLALGLYFVKQTGDVKGFAPCASFLVTVPGESADGYVYEVNATPKTEVAKLVPITIKKVWNTDASAKAADSVTVQLRRKGKVVKTAILNEENNWQIVYDDMPESDEYSIKEVDVPKGFTATYQQSGYVFTVTNSSTLIQTGQPIWPIPVLSAGGMLLIAVGVVLLQKKRESNA